jgi:hypothetical protein
VVTRTQNNFARNRLNAYLYHKNALAYAAGRYREWGRAEFPAEAAAEMARLKADLARMEASGA